MRKREVSVTLRVTSDQVATKAKISMLEAADEKQIAKSASINLELSTVAKDVALGHEEQRKNCMDEALKCDLSLNSWLSSAAKPKTRTSGVRRR